jgi:nitrite reductase/ring-hydroxylating ferredoxin subunit
VAGIVGDRVVSSVTEGGAHAGRTELVPAGASWRPVTTVAELERRPVVRFSAGSVTGFVIRNSAGVLAMSAVCTHQGCILEPSVDLSRLDCPCHNQSFALNGVALAGDYYLAPLPTLRSRVNGEAVEVFV